MILSHWIFLLFWADFAVPPSAPSVEKIRNSIQLPKDLKIELVASDPLIQSPVAAVFDEKGRLWVVEMPDYPNGPKPGTGPQGAIKILEDTNKDGQFDKVTLFAQNLLFANGLLPWKNGVFVTCAPQILYLSDQDGDGVSDRKEILFEGFVDGNPQLRVSFPVLGQDGWVYVANGLRGGTIKRPGDPAGKAIAIGGRDFRFHPETLQGEAVTGPGQFGNTIGRWGDRFVCDNRHHLRHVVLEDRDIRRNNLARTGELLFDISGEEPGPLSSGGKVYPLSRNWTTSNLHAGRFTAACGVFAFGGTGLGPQHQDAIFTCDPTGNLIHEEVLAAKGGTFAATAPQVGREFLATPEEWFRPVSLAHGPDGALYVVDMCRAVIEHPEFMPPELRNRPDLLLGKEKGRIWRISSRRPSEPVPIPDFSKDSAKVLALGSSEGWQRENAHRLIYQEISQPKWKSLLELALSSASPDERFHALWLFASAPGADAKALQPLLADKDARVVRGALKAMVSIAGPSIPPEALFGLANHPDESVRFQVALAAGSLPQGDRAKILARVALTDGSDPWTALAIQSSASGAQAKVLSAILESSVQARKPVELCRELARQAGVSCSDSELFAVSQLAIKQNDPDLGRRILAGLQSGLRASGKSIDTLLRNVPEWDATWNREVDRVNNKVENLAARQDSLEIVLARKPYNIQFLENLALHDPDPQMRILVSRQIAELPWDQAGPILLKEWKVQPPSVRRERIELLGRSPDRILGLFNQIENREISSREIDPARSRQWISHPDARVREKAKALLSGNIPAARDKVLADYRLSAEKDGDALKGKLVFAKNCATCHKVADVGMDVGPDISDTRTKTKAALLLDILNPNQAIDNNYVGYIVHLKNGKTSTGMISSSNSSSITIVRAENQTEIIPQDQIEELQSTGQSLMPEGLEKNVSVEDMADLLRFLKDWRYLDGKTTQG
jgi:putative membrane-bound dehydrogenase-like protein